MSKNAAKGELRPFSSTSFHQWLPELAMHMWLGTTSMISPMPRCFSAAASASRSPSRADLGVQARMVDDVVAVHAAGPRDQEGRGVDVRDAQGVQVVDQRGCVAKVEALV